MREIPEGLIKPDTEDEKYYGPANGRTMVVERVFNLWKFVKDMEAFSETLSNQPAIHHDGSFKTGEVVDGSEIEVRYEIVVTEFGQDNWQEVDKASYDGYPIPDRRLFATRKRTQKSEEEIKQAEEWLNEENPYQPETEEHSIFQGGALHMFINYRPTRKSEAGKVTVQDDSKAVDWMKFVRWYTGHDEEKIKQAVARYTRQLEQ